MLQVARVMIVFEQACAVGTAPRHVEPYLVFRLVRTVPAAALRRPDLDPGEGFLSRQLPHIVGDAIFVAELLGFEFPAVLVTQDEQHPRIDDGLPFEHVPEIAGRHRDVGEHLEIRFPTDDGAGILFGIRFLLQAADVLPMFEVQGVAEPVPLDLHVHVFRGILGRTGAQAVEAEGVFVTLPFEGVVFAAGVQLTEDQLPVVPAFLLVEVHRHAPAEILHLEGAILIPGGDNAAAEPLPGLVDRVGKDFEYCVLTAFQPVRSEDDRRAFADPVGPFQGGDAVVAVAGLFGGHNLHPSFNVLRASILKGSHSCRKAGMAIACFIPFYFIPFKRPRQVFPPASAAIAAMEPRRRCQQWRP